ncbi:hypothetical protein SNE40_015904 [Patella caerulea]|uniref:Sulfatase N-terminal domain-containing protein n=2 Tax=Patella caerulea TaxID=87958 RepID=A0AAN8JC19_PATCE
MKIWYPSTCLLLSLSVILVHCRRNVLFLVSDDMRPELPIYYGPDFPTPVHPPMHSPNLDMLASKSLLLKRAYVQQAVCSPSRTSLLTGRRPDTTHVYDLVKYFRNVGGNFTTIPEYFKQQGYRSIGMGKIFHPGRASGHDDPISWTEPYFHAPNLGLYGTRNHSWRAVPRSEYEVQPLPDTQLADNAIKVLRDVAPAARSGGKNFFVAVGFHKPHLPFIFPEDFLASYPTESIHLPDNEFAPVNMPEVAWSGYGELRAYLDILKLNASGNPNTSLPNDVVMNLRRAYYSALSHTDNELGRVLQELENLGLANDTIISFWGDHGWQLGEHGEWCKHTNFEDAVHAPMMIHVPGVTDKGLVTERLTEFVDLFPTLVEAAELEPLPLCPENSDQIGLCREGTSLMPLMRDPTMEWKEAVFSQYPRSKNGLSIMGYSIRTDQYRYTEWPGFSGPPAYKPEWETMFGAELYDHNSDPEENYNRADDPKYATIRNKLRDQLRTGWRKFLPPV